MNNSQQPQLPDWLISKLAVLEVIFSFIAIFCLGLKYATDIHVGIFLIGAFGVLSMIYILSAYVIIDDPEAGAMEILTSKVIAYASAVSTVGIMFSIQHWPGAAVNLLGGTISLVIALIMILASRSKKPHLTVFNNQIIMRVLILIAIGSALYFS